MKLLIITQKVNKEDSILGFFHSWIEEFSKHVEKVIVICLEKGSYNLPENVEVLSLGKEEGVSKLKYLIRFYRYIWRERNNYDAVFVHMNQEYLLLGGVLWKFLKKRIYMWRNHHAGNILTDFASWYCNKIFCTSKYSYTAKYKKTILMPVGIDTRTFKRINQTRADNNILFIARISPSKRLELLLSALFHLKEDGYKFVCNIYGDALDADKKYFDALKNYVDDNFSSSEVIFHGAVANYETPIIYNQHAICVNLSSSGMFDKTIFESLACGCLALSSNRNLDSLIDRRLIFEELNKIDLKEKIEVLLNLSSDEKEKIIHTSKDLVFRNSLEMLIGTLIKVI